MVPVAPRTVIRIPASLNQPRISGIVLFHLWLSKSPLLPAKGTPTGHTQPGPAALNPRGCGVSRLNGPHPGPVTRGANWHLVTTPGAISNKSPRIWLLIPPHALGSILQGLKSLTVRLPPGALESCGHDNDPECDPKDADKNECARRLDFPDFSSQFSLHLDGRC